MEDTRAWFDATGPIEAPTLVFLHGAAWTRAMWRPQVERLSGMFHVMALDLPGHGALAGEPFRLNTAIEHIEQALDICHRARAVVVGLSLGGYVAMAYAARYPERCAGLALSGCCIEYRGLIGALSALDATISTRLYGARRLEAMQRESVRKTYPPALADPQFNAGFFFQAMPAVYSELARQRFQPLLQKYPGPSLIINGEHDKLNRRGEARLLAAAQHGELRIIANAGHLCNLDQPESFTEAMQAFARFPYLRNSAPSK